MSDGVAIAALTLLTVIAGTTIPMLIKLYCDMRALHDQSAKRSEVLETVSADIADAKVNIERIKMATNGLVSQLVAETEAEALARGASDEKIRADDAIRTEDDKRKA